MPQNRSDCDAHFPESLGLFSPSELPTCLPLPPAHTSIPELLTVKPPLIQTGHPRAQSPQHSCPSDVCPAISGARQATLNSSPPDNPAQKDEDETRRRWNFLFFFSLMARQAVSPSHTRTHWSQKSLGGYLKEQRTEEWDANVMIESVAILIDGLIR